MLTIGVDYHPSGQYIAFADTETREHGERRLNYRDGEARDKNIYSVGFDSPDPYT